MKKAETLEAVTNLLTKHKVKKESELFQELIKMFEAKSRATVDDFPNILNDKKEVVEVYCSWFKEYRPVEEFSLSTKNKSGYFNKCNDGKAEWRKYDKEIKAQKSGLAELTNAILDESISIEEGKTKRAETLAHIEKLENARHDKINFADFKQSLLDSIEH